MERSRELLEGTATVKATMLLAHLAWVKERLGDPLVVLAPGLSAEAARLVETPPLATQWIPFRLLVEIDRAIAVAAGGDASDTLVRLGQASARVNLTGIYKTFVASEPHRFFEKSALLHDRFQNFGRAAYERTGERSGRMSMVGYGVHSPVYCLTGAGFYEEALKLLQAPGPVVVVEKCCRCAGDDACVYEMSW